jgi:hypothetical protein
MAKRAIRYRDAVASYNNLPIGGNTLGDVRTTRDTGIQYWWSIVAAVGARTDWRLLNDKIPSTVDEQEKDNLELEMAFKAAVLSRYSEYTYAAKNLTRIDIYTDNTKVTQLFSKVMTYVGKNLTQTVLTRISDGATLTKSFTYVGKNLTNVTVS